MANMNDRVTELEHQVAALTALVEQLTRKTQMWTAPHAPLERKREDFRPFPRWDCLPAVDYKTSTGQHLSGEIMCGERQVEPDLRRKTPDEFRLEGLM